MTDSSAGPSPVGPALTSWQRRRCATGAGRLAPWHAASARDCEGALAVQDPQGWLGVGRTTVDRLMTGPCGLGCGESSWAEGDEATLRR